MSESPVAAACRRVREIVRVACMERDEYEEYVRGDHDPSLLGWNAENLLPVMEQRSLDLLCGEGGALLKLEAEHKERVALSIARNKGRRLVHQNDCEVCALLRRPAEELGGGGS